MTEFGVGCSLPLGWAVEPLPIGWLRDRIRHRGQQDVVYVVQSCMARLDFAVSVDVTAFGNWMYEKESSSSR
jgi:hypothetical protein